MMRDPRRAACVALLALAACGGRQAATVPTTAADSATMARLAQEQGAPLIGKKNAIGVTPFAAPPGDTLLGPLAFALSDLLTTDLSKAKQLVLVERGRLDDILREQKLTEGGRVDEATAPQAGRLIGASRLVVGGVGTLPQQSIRLDARIAEVSTGGIRKAVSGQAPLNDVLAAEKEVAFRILDALGVTLTPGERAAIETKPTSNLEALVAYGQGRQAELAGDWVRARRDYRRAFELDAGFPQPQLRLQQVSETESIKLPPIAVPSVVQTNGAADAALDRVNRPLDQILPSPPNNTITAPSPITQVTEVILIINRP